MNDKFLIDMFCIHDLKKKKKNIGVRIMSQEKACRQPRDDYYFRNRLVLKMNDTLIWSGKKGTTLYPKRVCPQWDTSM